MMDSLPEGYRAIAPDMRGYGWTEAKPIDATRGYRDWSDDLAALFKAMGVGDIKVDVVISVDTVGRWYGVAVWIEDALVEGFAEGPREPWLIPPGEGAAPLDVVEDGVMFCDQGGVEEYPLREG